MMRLRSSMLILGLTATAVVGSTLSAQAVLVADPGSSGSDLATCGSPDTSVAGKATYNDSLAPIVKSLQWRLTTPTVKAAPVLDVPTVGVVAAIRGRVVQKCSGADSLTSAPAARALVTFTTPGAPAPYPLTATDSSVATNALPFDQTIFGLDRRWCPSEAGHTTVASVTTRRRFSTFTLIDGSPATLDPSTTSAGVDATNPLVAPAASPLLRTKTRAIAKFSTTEVKVGRSLTVFGWLSRLTSGARKAPVTTMSKCGAASWVALPSRKLTLTIAAPNWKLKNPWVVRRTFVVITDAAGRAQVPLSAAALRSIKLKAGPGVLQFTWKVAASNLPAWLTPSGSVPQFVFVD